MKTTCPAPDTPEFYADQVDKDMRATCDHALDMLKKCEVESHQWDFYFAVVRHYVSYHEEYRDCDS